MGRVRADRVDESTHARPAPPRKGCKADCTELKRQGAEEERTSPREQMVWPEPPLTEENTEKSTAPNRRRLHLHRSSDLPSSRSTVRGRQKGKAKNDQDMRKGHQIRGIHKMD
ncbi:unnamed protein product [Linum trigynum]|uniref:Uncharacterized protein n=1 Tax=Linum trigynum TaxID=586398 RepID=A0AAV2CU77_9ROSI